MATILVVDDDKNVRFLVHKNIQEEGYHVLQASGGPEALELLGNNQVDLAVIDVMMPEMDGFELTKQVKSNYGIPVILLTAKGQISDKETGFRLGADDYIVKPFNPKELLFRIQAILKRYNKPSDSVIAIGEVSINRKNYEVQVGERTLILPLKEFELLFYMASYPNQVLSRPQIIEAVWGLDFNGDERTVNVHVKRLRERFSSLTDDITIKTVRGLGYLLEDRQE
ncbi:response regulator transcription factor [Mesobacillus zeae]|uniref:Heme response regulator HssR n=1 Tax=Mesobacillus zeae TaxID=1917180 RepID=A0A398BCD9_9BACI|nr:response regulator transcription factor [Mesobacillus zeae]RID87502.1 DNA-binding response regulator [Mesobacillus zeae]